VGAFGVVIPDGSSGQQAATIIDVDGNIYSCTNGGTIPLGGSITLSFANNVPGPIAIPSTNAVSIYQAIPGWDSVTVASGVLGNDTESRSELEARRAASVSGNSFGAIGAIIAKVAEVPGVLDYFGYDNGEATTVTVANVTIAANSIYVAVVGGDNTAIAQAILSKKSGGCGFTGNTTVTAYDSNPLYSAPVAYSITFERPGSLQVIFSVVLFDNPNIPSNAATLIQNAIINAFAGGDGGPRARVGSTILATRFIAPIALLGPWAQVQTLAIGSINTPAVSFTGAIAGTTLTTSGPSGGSIAIGQTVIDAAGLVIPGTVITGGSGSSWTINTSQTVASGAMFGVLANQSTVWVNGNQAPEVVAGGIVVTTS
jgi:hypothetical protein